MNAAVQANARLTCYSLAGRTVPADDPQLQQALESVYGSTHRPRCLCVDGGVEMYVSRFSNFVVKRMPGTGHLHAPTCDSFALEGAETGRGLHEGHAIVSLPNGRLRVRLGFPLSHHDASTVRAVPRRSESIDSDGTRLSLNALLHLLWEEAGFNKWSPKMKGKRHWGLIRHFLLEAANDIEAAGGRLIDHLLIPETFRIERKQQLAERLHHQLAKLDFAGGAVRPLLIVIGQLKNLEETTRGAKAVIKHLGDLNLHADGSMIRKLKRHFGAAIESAQTDRRLVLILACTICQERDDSYSMDTATVMMVNREWIPVANRFEQAVAEALIEGGRSFLKAMRYGAREAQAFADFILRDTDGGTVPMDIVVEGKNAAASEAKKASISKRGSQSWVWWTGQSMHMPPFPPAAALKRGLAPGDVLRNRRLDPTKAPVPA